MCVLLALAIVAAVVGMGAGRRAWVRLEAPFAPLRNEVLVWSPIITIIALCTALVELSTSDFVRAHRDHRGTVLLLHTGATALLYVCGSLVLHLLCVPSVAFHALVVTATLALLLQAWAPPLVALSVLVSVVRESAWSLSSHGASEVAFSIVVWATYVLAYALDRARAVYASRARTWGDAARLLFPPRGPLGGSVDREETVPFCTVLPIVFAVIIGGNALASSP